MIKYKAKYFEAEQAAFHGAVVLFNFEGFRFIEGTDAKDTPHYLIADHNGEDSKKPVFYELHLEDFYNLLAKYLISLQPGHKQAATTLRNELERITEIK